MSYKTGIPGIPGLEEDGQGGVIDEGQLTVHGQFRVGTAVDVELETSYWTGLGLPVYDEAGNRLGWLALQGEPGGAQPAEDE